MVHKTLVKSLKNKIQTIINTNPDAELVKRHIQEIFFKNAKLQNINSETYTLLASNIVVYRSILIQYKVS